MSLPLSTEEMFENFSYMVIEEFLKKKNMHNTLNEMRNEWDRPSEEQTLLSWYDVALKLRLPELIALQVPVTGTGSSKSTTSSGLPPQTPVLESLLYALIRESSVRNRRTVDVTLSGLAASFKSQKDQSPVIPSEVLEDSIYESDDYQEAVNETQQSVEAEIDDEANEINDIAVVVQNKDREKRTKNRERDAHNLSLLNQVMINNKNISNENWIPEEQRMQSIGRNFKVAKECLVDIQKRETIERREMKSINVTDLAKAKVKETLGSLKKIDCGCCMRKFLDVNLPLKVSKKAIMDIRIMWSGSLNSKTVFGGSPVEKNKKSDSEQYDTDGDSDTELQPASTSNADSQGGNDKKMAILTRLGCYESASVCIFCAQFFSHQEEYRPSYSTITFRERKAIHFENKRKEQEYWNPLKMMEKDRLILEKRQIKMMNSGEKDDSGIGDDETINTSH